MKRFYLKGILHYSKEDDFYIIGSKNLYEELCWFAQKNYNGNGGVNERDDEDYFGGKDIILYGVNLRIYATEQKSTLENAIASVIDVLEGTLESKADYYGYSEYTIMGLEVEKFKIGGHNLKEELKRYLGKYVHFVLEV